ncbi:hypothetical protein [Alkalinema sp. FACHB-956]|uniref:hypothetical protein n=1 Tax=Alkalinema sp. FACHB-956 TaxID=2692768 RepID=UPI001687EEBB|nr:hypothetical protein [Alkalinema sp. FACHB-956]MBD2325768.1 hypothetical protein [Alkalinema sp. FACHB-956]
MKSTVFLILAIVVSGLPGVGAIAHPSIELSDRGGISSSHPGLTPGNAMGFTDPSQTPQRTSLAAEPVTVTEEVVKFVRDQGDALGRREAIVKYPKISGMADPALQEKVQAAIGLQQAFGKSVEEMRVEFEDYAWLNELSYTVNYNQHSILDITYRGWGTGAYPSGFERYLAVNLKTGTVIYAHHLFKTEALGQVARLVNQVMQAEIQKKMAEVKQDYGEEEIDLKIYAAHQFRVKDLNHFTITDRGIIFHYEYGFPHVLKAAEPEDSYLLSYDQLKPFIRSNGVLSQLLGEQNAP